MGTRHSGRGRNALRLHLVEQALELLKTHTIVNTARLLRVSVRSIQRIAKGEHAAQRDGQPLVRCGCGALLTGADCLACRLRNSTITPET